MTDIINLEEFKNKKLVKDKSSIIKVHQQILEDLIRSMVENGVDVNERVEKSLVPMIKIIESILYEQNGLSHPHSQDVDRFIEMAFTKDDYHDPNNIIEPLNDNNND
jgi:hypothetical protein